MSNDRRKALLSELFAEVRAGQNAVDAMDDAAAGYLGINRTDFRCLDVIDRSGRMTPGELATESGLTTGAITAVLDRLERGGFVRRTRDDEDRRRIFVELTPEAHARTGELYAPIAANARTMMADLTDDQLEQFIGILRAGREVNRAQAARVRAMTRGRTIETLREARDVVKQAAKEAKQMTKEALKEAAMAARPDRARRRRGEEGTR
jgi:DNA-binding MarR family transcriptional regulator